MSKFKKQSRREYKDGIFCVTFELETEKWQQDVIDKRLSDLMLIYNSLNCKLKRIYHDMTERREYKKVASNLSERKMYIQKYSIPYVKKNPKAKGGNFTQPFTEFGILNLLSKYTATFSKACVNSSMTHCMGC